MSDIRMSRKPLANPEPPTLADLLQRTSTDLALTPRQRQDMASALRTLSRALQQPLDELPAHPGQLRTRLKSFTPAMAGLSERRWYNVLSLVRKVLDQAGIKQMPGRSRLPFAPAWTALLGPLTLRDGKAGLSRLARHCSDQGITPEQVDDVVFAAVLADLTDGSMRTSPRKVQRRAAVIWNRLAATRPDWPQQRVTVPDNRRAFALPWSAFPASLAADVEACLDRLAGKDILEELEFRPLRPTSIRSRRAELRAYLSALVLRGRDPQTLHTLADVVAVDVVKDGLRFFLDRDKSNKQAYQLAGVLRSLARHWVKVEPAHLIALQAICKRLDPRQVGMTEKNRSRLRQFDDQANVRALLGLPERLLAAAIRAGAPTREQALCVQTAVAIEILLMVPIRRKNLAELDFERHLPRSRAGVLHLTIPGAEVKNGVDIEAVLPASVVRLIDIYRKTYRPLLLTSPSSCLFPGVNGRPKSRERLAWQISRCLKESCGLLVNPHLFRHIAAKLYLKANPGGYGMVKLLHGHRSVETTTRFYCGTETAAAMDHYDAHVLGLREGPDGADRGTMGRGTGQPRRGRA